MDTTDQDWRELAMPRIPLYRRFYYGCFHYKDMNGVVTYVWPDSLVQEGAHDSALSREKRSSWGFEKEMSLPSGSQPAGMTAAPFSLFLGLEAADGKRETSAVALVP